MLPAEVIMMTAMMAMMMVVGMVCVCGNESVVVASHGNDIACGHRATCPGVAGAEQLLALLTLVLDLVARVGIQVESQVQGDGQPHRVEAPVAQEAHDLPDLELGQACRLTQRD